jgi:serine/threonine protein phosphatase 1
MTVIMACYVIGDIHGCVSELTYLLENLPLKPADQIVFLGDYIDRGPDSKAVVSYLIGMAKAIDNEMVFLKGNHEDMLLAYLGFAGNYGEMFLANGGQATLASYGIPPMAMSQDSTMARIPADHLNFFLGLKNYHVHDSFLCVHAGVQPLKALEVQSDIDMLWIRNEFIANRHRLPYTVIFGHTPQIDVLFDLPSKIGIDTGVVYGRKLSCIELDEKNLFQIDRGARRVRQTSINHMWLSRLKSSMP